MEWRESFDIFRARSMKAIDELCISYLLHTFPRTKTAHDNQVSLGMAIDRSISIHPSIHPSTHMFISQWIKSSRCTLDTSSDEGVGRRMIIRLDVALASVHVPRLLLIGDWWNSTGSGWSILSSTSVFIETHTDTRYRHIQIPTHTHTHTHTQNDL